MNIKPAALRPDEAGSYLSLSPQRLARLRLEGGGPTFCRAGRSILYRVEDLDRWLNSSLRSSTSDVGSTQAMECNNGV